MTADAPTFILSIDPGLQGALCLYETSTRRIQLFDTPSIKNQVDGVRLAQIVDMLNRPKLHAVVENVSGRPGQAGVFAFGRSTGLVHGILNALGIPYETVAPSQWKPAMGLRRLLNETQAQNKTKARELAIRLWPEMASSFKLVKNHDRAEAALLARYYANSKGFTND